MEKRNNIYEFLAEVVENTAKISCDNEAIVLLLGADETARDAVLGREEHTAKAYLVKENLVKENLAKQNLVKQNLVKQDLVKENLVKQDLVKENLVKQNLAKESG